MPLPVPCKSKQYLHVLLCFHTAAQPRTLSNPAWKGPTPKTWKPCSQGTYRRVRNNCRTRPYEFIGFGAMRVTKPYKSIWFGNMPGPKPYEITGSRATIISHTPVCPNINAIFDHLRVVRCRWGLARRCTLCFVSVNVRGLVMLIFPCHFTRCYAIVLPG
jgi:hypothetical protein